MPERVPRIVAGVSELDANDPTLLVATEVARASGAELHLVHAYHLPPLMTLSPGLELAYPEGSTQYHRLLLDALQAAAHALPGGEAARCRVVLGPPAPVLASVAGELRADLLIVGAARGSRLGREMLGTTAQRVLRAATMPVLVARRPAPAALQRVLLTSDLSELSAAVHERALETLARFFHPATQLRSLLVLGWSPLPSPLTPEVLDRAAHEELESFLRDRPRIGPPVEGVVRTGLAADEIVAEAREWNADLLVVGTHARGWGARMMLGSVAEAALRDAPCNVLAVPPVPTAAVLEVGTAHPVWSEPREPAQSLAAAHR